MKTYQNHRVWECHRSWWGGSQAWCLSETQRKKGCSWSNRRKKQLLKVHMLVKKKKNRYLNSVTEMGGAKYIWMSNWMRNHLNAANTRAEVMRQESEAKLWVDSSHTDLCGRSHFYDTSWSPWWAGRCSCGLYQVGRRWDVLLRAPTCSAPTKK